MKPQQQLRKARFVNRTFWLIALIVLLMTPQHSTQAERQFHWSAFRQQSTGLRQVSGVCVGTNRYALWNIAANHKVDFFFSNHDRSNQRRYSYFAGRDDHAAGSTYRQLGKTPVVSDLTEWAIRYVNGGYEELFFFPTEITLDEETLGPCLVGPGFRVSAATQKRSLLVIRAAMPNGILPPDDGNPSTAYRYVAFDRQTGNSSLDLNNGRMLQENLRRAHYRFINGQYRYDIFIDLSGIHSRVEISLNDRLISTERFEVFNYNR
jgi:hypothetical protein